MNKLLKDNQSEFVFLAFQEQSTMSLVMSKLIILHMRRSF